MTPDTSPARVDVELMWRLFARFVGADTGARIGENRIEPTDERLATFARDVAAPTFAELGADVSIDELNNVVGRFGPDRGSELLLVGYPALHHGNEMADPLVARRVDDAEGACWVGLGAGQAKGALAAACAAVRLVREQGIDLAGRVTLVACSEGSSTHASSERLYEGFEQLPAGAVLLVETEGRISLGNRGRIDVVVEVEGASTHSSAPETGLNPIPLVGEVLSRLARLDVGADEHDLLGCRALTPYKLVCGPIAPHTIPSRCVVTIDRRTLPDDDEREVVESIGSALEGLPVTVRQGPTMLPALVDESSPLVRTLQDGAERSLGRRLETFYPRYTFDAGYGCSLGVPTVMLGPSSPEIADVGVLGEDSVRERELVEAAAVYAAAIACVRP